MRKATEIPLSLQEMEQRVKELDARHQQEMRKSHDTYAKDYMTRAIDAYQSVDDALELAELDVSHSTHPPQRD